MRIEHKLEPQFQSRYNAHSTDLDDQYVQSNLPRLQVRPLFASCLLLIALATFCTTLQAPCRAAAATNTLTGLNNTGLTDAGTPGADGVADTHWKIVATPASSTTSATAYIALQNWPVVSGYWMGDSNSSKWLSPVANVYQNAQPGKFTYQTTFTVTGDPTQLGFIGKCAADDQVVDIVLNGKTVASNLDSNFTKWTTFNISSGLVAGTNTLQFVVQNNGTTPTPSGFRAEFSSYSVAPPAPTPAPAPAPVTPTGKPLSIVQVVPNDDSAKITFVAYPGAADYRIINLASPNSSKYAGYAGTNGVVTIEMNGLNPTTGSDLIIQATDALGPFQDMDPYMTPIPNMVMVINGHGSPFAAPNVLATSSSFHVTCQPKVLTGTQTFFDNFRSPLPFQPAPLNPALAQMHTFSSQVCYQEFQNDKWNLTAFDHDTTNSRFFFMGSHFMDILYDFHQILRAKTVMSPKSHPTLQPGQVLHVTWEVDSYVSLNRTLGVLIVPASDTINYPPDGSCYTTNGNIFDWQIASDAHHVNVYTGGIQRGAQSATYGVANSARWMQQWASGPMGGGLNGGEADLDRRHQFDLYLSSTRYVILENGQVMNDIPLNCIYAGAPGQVWDDTLGWFYKQPVKVAFYHYLYHSVADNYYLQNGEMFPLPAYWLNRRQSSDERHWDNMGFEVLTQFPKF